MKKSIVAGVISVMIVVILLGSMLVPIIQENENGIMVDKKTTLNNQGTSLVKGDPTADYTMYWDSALPGTIKVNGNVITVYFVAGDDATVSPDHKGVVQDLTYGELPTPTRTGYTFDGWYTSTAYTTEVTEDTLVEGSSDKILYAKWVANEYTVTFDADGGTVSPGTKTVTFGSAYGELPTPTYTGHIFAGWFDENNEPITAASIVNVADDQTLTAAWTLEQYLVSFTTDGNGSVDVASVLVDYGTSYTISSNTVVVGDTTVTATASTGYVFDHWTPGTSGTITAATTFIASFNNPPVTVTFTANSPGSVSSNSIADVPIGTQYVVADNVVTITGFTPVTASLPDGYYMIGWNIAQGVGTITEAMTFTAQYEMIEIADVICSNNTTWAVTTDGKLFGCGMNTNGQQGDGTTTNVTTFTQRLSTETIDTVVCSDYTTWAVTTDGKLFGCGLGSSGQQGSGNTTNVTSFTQRLSGETIAMVDCSNKNTWAVTTDGKLFGCGYNSNGQQSDGTTTDVKSFTQRLSGETIAMVDCTDIVTWAITTDGKLFGCGGNAGYQQGDGTTTDVTTFTQRLDTETVVKVYAYDTPNETNSGTTWALTTDGKVFGCGSNSKGQQGGGGVTTFTQRLSGENIKGVNCSGSTSWIVTTDGKLFGCGYNISGQQGDGTTTNVTTFTQRLSGETISKASSCNFTTWAITTDGKLFGCGLGSSGQQGSGTTTGVKTFTQRGPPGSVNIAPVLNPIPIITPINPGIIINPIIPLSTVTAADITSTDYTFLAGGEDWLLCSVSIGVDAYGLALYYDGLAAPLVWDSDLTLEFSNGSLTVTNNGQSYTMQYDSIYFLGKGDYVLMTSPAYVFDDTDVIGYAIPTTDSGIIVKGTIGSLTPLSIADGSITSLVSATAAYDGSDYDDVSILSGIEVAYDSDTASCTSIIVPKKIVITTTVEDHTIDAILSAIPMIVIAALLLASVTIFISRRME